MAAEDTPARDGSRTLKRNRSTLWLLLAAILALHALYLIGDRTGWGEFNSPATLPSFRPLRAFLVDAWEIAGQGWPGTATADLPVVRVDQCWSTPNLRPVSARSIPERVSDHRLLLVQYELSPQ